MDSRRGHWRLPKSLWQDRSLSPLFTYLLMFHNITDSSRFHFGGYLKQLQGTTSHSHAWSNLQSRYCRIEAYRMLRCFVRAERLTPLSWKRQAFYVISSELSQSRLAEVELPWLQLSAITKIANVHTAGIDRNEADGFKGCSASWRKS